MKKLQLTDYFPKIVDPKTLSKGKPDPEIYLKGAELINLKPEQCIGVEDAAAGVESINAAGETSIGIGDKTILKDADVNFTDTSEMTLANIKKTDGLIQSIWKTGTIDALIPSFKGFIPKFKTRISEWNP